MIVIFSIYGSIVLVKMKLRAEVHQNSMGLIRKKYITMMLKYCWKRKLSLGMKFLVARSFLGQVCCYYNFSGTIILSRKHE